MIIKDIVKNAALILGKNDVVSYLNGNTTVGHDTFETLGALTNLCYLVIDELACTYIPIIKKTAVTFVNGKYEINHLNGKVVRIIAVYDLEGQKVDFSAVENLVCANVKQGAIEYEYLPQCSSIDDEVGYSENDISTAVLAHGVAAEYCITQNLFEQAVMYHKRYVDAIAEICAPKNKKIKARSWV